MLFFLKRIKKCERSKLSFMQTSMMLVIRLYVFVRLLNRLVCQRNFPMNELYNVPSGLGIRADEQFCNGATSNQNCCDCNDICLRFKTCCVDKLWNSSNPIPLQEYLEILVNKTSKYKDTTCESVFPLVPDSQNMYMVSTCEDGANQADTEGCLNPKLLSYEYTIPVFGNDSYLYKNSFCARCNLIETFAVVNLTARCKSSTINTFGPKIFFEGTTTTTTTTPPPKTNLYEKLRGCYFDIARTNSISNVVLNYCQTEYNYNRNIGCHKSNEYYQRCLSYYGFAETSAVAYANYHCYLCNSTNVDQAKIDIPYLHCNNRIDKSKRGLQWSFTLSFSSQTSLDIYGPGISNSDSFCEDGELYNIITSKCEVFSCSAGYQKVGNICQKVKPSKVIFVKRPSFDRCLIGDKVSIIAETNTTVANATSIENEIKNILNISLNSRFNYLFKAENVSFSQFTVNLTNNTLEKIKNFLTQPDITLWKTIRVLYISSIENQIATMLYGVAPKRTFPGGRICVDPVTEINPLGNFTINCSYEINNKSTNYLELSLFLTVKPGEFLRTVSICSSYHLHSPCRLREIVSEYTIARNRTLFAENKQYNSSEYAPTESGISICVEELKPEYKWYISVLNAEKYISYIGTSISILCYIGIILIFTFIRELKNIASMTIVALSATLLFADTIFLTATQLFKYEMACKVVAIFLHWALLAAQTWTAVIAFDVLSKFGSVTLALTKTSTKRFTQYCCLAYLLPSIIVAVTVTLNETGVYNIGYGASNTCFIYNFYPKLYFYIVPFTVTFTSTVSCCLFTIFFISKHEAKSRELLSDSGRSKRDVISIAFKLILALGIIEIVGLIQISRSSLTESELIFNSIFAVTYTILRSLRGAILFYIYVLSKENKKDLKTKFKANKYKTVTRSTELQSFNTVTTKP